MKTSRFLHLDCTPASTTNPRTRQGAVALGLLVVGLIATLGTGSIVEAADVTLAWASPANNIDTTPLTDLAGYRVYYGTASQSYTTIRDVGLVTTATVPNLPSGSTCFFAVTAYDTAGNESDFSTEMVWTGPLVDSDGDGITDIQELLAGTNPYNANSVLQMNRPYRPTGVGGTGMAIEWTSVTGKYYTVQRSTNLMASPAFTDIASHVPAQTPVTVYTDTTATAEGPYFYRVQVEP